MWCSRSKVLMVTDNKTKKRRVWCVDEGKWCDEVKNEFCFGSLKWEDVSSEEQ